jgi:hypothetical protein
MGWASLHNYDKAYQDYFLYKGSERKPTEVGDIQICPTVSLDLLLYF